jgi:hypothetical protein
MHTIHVWHSSSSSPLISDFTSVVATQIDNPTYTTAFAPFFEIDNISNHIDTPPTNTHWPTTTQTMQPPHCCP